MRATYRIILFTILLALAGSAGIPARAAFPVSAGTSIAASSAVSEEELIHNRMVMERLFHDDRTGMGEKTEPGYTLLLLGAATVLVPCIILLAGRNKKRWSIAPTA